MSEVSSIPHSNHDDHHHHKETFITKYIFSQDHKMIAKQYLILGVLFMGFIGVAMSLLFRLQLAWPEQSFAVFDIFLGDWAPEGVMDPNIYLALVTIHGTIMVFFVLTAGLSGTFSNLLIPLQIGARDMASGLLNMISFWLFFLSSMIMLASLFVEAGPAAAGWTIYPPLSALPQAQPGSGMDNLSSFKCIASSSTWFGYGNDTLVDFNGYFCCFIITWIT
jgi:cytochrome c oxidase subunit 1